MFRFLLAFVLLSPLPVLAINYTAGDTLTVVALDGLTVRAGADTQHEKLGLLPTGSRVSITATPDFSAPGDTIFGLPGHWVAIESLEGLSGYAFDAFLSTLPVAAPELHFYRPERQRSIDEYYTQLPELLKDYALAQFGAEGCSMDYFNRVDGASAHSMTFQQLSGGHTLIEHHYWEGYATELRLSKVRLSEAYYLTRQLFAGIAESSLELKDGNLKAPRTYLDWRSDCAANLPNGDCLVRLFEDEEYQFSLIFEFPCC